MTLNVWYLTEHMTDTPTPQRRALVSLGDQHDRIADLAKKKGLALATFLRSLILTHPDVAERADGSRNR